MGYHTNYEGRVEISPPLNAAEVAYLRRFNESRRWDRTTGPYDTDDTYAYTRGNAGLGNRPPSGQPELWCPWRPTDDGTALEWDGCEKPYEGEAWMRYLVNHFLRPGAAVQHLLAGGDAPDGWVVPEEFARFTFNHTLNGGFHAEGEERNDVWTLIVASNDVMRAEGHVPLPDPNAATYTAERVFPTEIEG